MNAALVSAPAPAVLDSFADAEGRAVLNGGLVGLVVGQGFKALIKPESWAASHAADHVVRTRAKHPYAGTTALTPVA